MTHIRKFQNRNCKELQKTMKLKTIIGNLINIKKNYASAANPLP